MGIRDLENIFEDKTAQTPEEKSEKERQQSLQRIFDDEGQAKRDKVKVETGRKTNQENLPKTTISAYDPDKYQPKEDGIFTKFAKLALPKNLEVKFGLTEPETTAERIVAHESARLNYYRKKREKKRIEENLAEKGKTIEDIRLPEGYEEPGALGQFKDGLLQSWEQTLAGIGGTIESVGGKISPELREFGEEFADKHKTIMLENPEWSRPEGLEFAEGGFKDPSWYARTAGELIPSIVGTFTAATAGGLLGGVPGATAAGGSFIYTIESGNAYNEMIDSGVAPDTASTASSIYGVIATGLEGISFLRVGNMVLKGSKLEALKGSYKKTLVRELPKTMAIEAGTEGSQELAQNLVTGFVNKNQPLFENVIEATAAGGVGGLGFGGVQVGIKAVKGGEGRAPNVESDEAPTQGTRPPEGGEQAVDTGVEGEQQVDAETGVETETTGVEASGISGLIDIFGTQEPTQEQVQKKSADLRNELNKAETRLSELDSDGIANLTAEQSQERQQVVDRITELRSTFTNYLDAVKEKTAELPARGERGTPLYAIEVARFSDGKWSYNIDVNTGNSGVGRPFITNAEELASSKREATEVAALEIRDWARQQLRRVDPKRSEGQQLQRILNDVESKIGEDTKAIEEVDLTDARATIDEMVVNLFTPEESFGRTVQELNNRWETPMDFFTNQVELPANEEIRKLNERLAGIPKKKETKEQRNTIQRRIKNLQQQVSQIENTITNDNIEFQDRLAGIVMATAQQSGGLELAYDPSKSFGEQGERALTFGEDVLSAIYERPGIEAYWTEPVMDVLNVFIEREGGSRVQEIIVPEEMQQQTQPEGQQGQEGSTQEAEARQQGEDLRNANVSRDDFIEAMNQFQRGEDVGDQFQQDALQETQRNLDALGLSPEQFFDQFVAQEQQQEGETAPETQEEEGATAEEAGRRIGERAERVDQAQSEAQRLQANDLEVGTPNEAISDTGAIQFTVRGDNYVWDENDTIRPASSDAQFADITGEGVVESFDEFVRQNIDKPLLRRAQDIRKTAKKTTRKKATKKTTRKQKTGVKSVKKRGNAEAATRVIDGRQSLNILKHAAVLDGTLRATNLEVYISTPTTLEDGAYKKVQSTLKPTQAFTVENLREDFPALPDVSNAKKKADVDGRTFAAELSATAKFLKKESVKPELGGVNVEMTKDGIVLTGTDSFRLLRRTVPANTGRNRESFIVGDPARLAEALTVFEGQIDVRRDTESNMIEFTDGKTSVGVREVQGEYPHVSEIYLSYQTQYKVNRKELNDALTGIKHALDNFKTLNVYVEDGQLVLHAENKNGDKDTARVDYEVQKIRTPEREAIDGALVMPMNTQGGVDVNTAGQFNHNFLQGAVQTYQTDDFFIRTISEEEGDFSLLKPLHVSGEVESGIKTLKSKPQKAEQDDDTAGSAPSAFVPKDIESVSRDEAQQEAQKDMKAAERRAKEVEGKDTRKNATPRSKPESGALGFNISNLAEGIRNRKARNETDKVVKRSEIASMLSRKLRVPIRRGRFRQAALGIFKPGQNVVRVREGGASQRQGGEISTIFHEVGHFIDYTIYQFRDAIPQNELESLTQEYGAPLRTPRRLKEEAFAEFLRFYMTQPERAQKIAPKFHKIFEDKMQSMPEVFDVIKAGQRDFIRWAEQPATAKVLSNISFGDRKDIEIGERIKEKTHHLYTLGVDDLHPIARYVELAEQNIGQLEAADNPYVLSRTLRGWVGKAELFLRQGTIEKQYWRVDPETGKSKVQFTGKPLSEILKPAEQKGALEELSAYLIARRAIELSGRKIPTGIAVEDAQQAVSDLEKRFPEFKQIQKEIQEYQDALLKYGHQNDLYNAQTLNKMKSLNKDYVPYYRVQEELKARGLQGRGMANVRNPIKRIKGSERDIIDPLESIVKNTYTIVNAADRNNVMQSFARAAKKDPNIAQMFEKVPQSQAKVASVKVGDILDNFLPETDPARAGIASIEDELVNIFRPSFVEKGNVITLLEDGKPQVYELAPELYSAVQAMEIEDSGMLIHFLSFPAQFLRAGATLSPDFMIRNPVRDQMTAFVFSKYGFKPVIDPIRGVWSLFNKDDAYMAWKAGGGEMATIVDVDRQVLSKSVKEIASMREQAKNVVKNPLRILQFLSRVSEQATRIGEARRAIDAGANPVESAFASREVTLDFGRAGAKVRAWNRITAFFNATVQGDDKMIRSFRNHPYRTTARVFNGITLPSIILYFLNRDEEGWDEIPQWQKNLFWLVKIDDTWWRIPKPFELGIIFGSIPERIVEAIDKQDPEVFDELYDAVRDGAAPGFLPTGLIPFIENMTNYSFFLDRPIVPRSRQDMPNADQYTQSTSEASKLMGQFLDMSPAKIENLINGYFAGLGRYALDVTDGVLKGTGIVNPVTEPEKTLADKAVVKAFVVREPIGSAGESVDRFFKKREEATKARNKYRELIEDGKHTKAREFLQENPEVKLYKAYNKMARRLSEIRKARRHILDSETLSAKQKREKIRELDKLMTTVAHRAINMELTK